MAFDSIRQAQRGRRRHRTLAIMIGVPLLTMSASIYAQEESLKLSLSGYGTLGVVRSSDSKSDYLTDAFKPNGPGYTRQWSADVDSRVGAQLTLQLTPVLSAVVQVISQQRYDNSYKPSVEWANLKYQVTPDFSVRAGRIVLPIFLLNDSRKVGYVNPWVRPPVEVYNLVPVTSSDGLDISYLFPTGEVTHTLQATYGRFGSKFPGGPDIGTGIAKARNLFALVDTIEFGSVTARVSYSNSILTIDAFNPLFDGFRQFGPFGSAIADKYSVNNKRVSFVGVGVGYDAGNWTASGEWAKVNARSILGARSAWYLAGGYRLGKLTPYLTYARLINDGVKSDPGLPTNFLPPQVAGIATALNDSLNSFLASTAAQKTISIGTRWDIGSNIALKLQYDQIRRAPGSPGTFGNIQPGFEPGGKANLLSATADFVF